MRLRNKILEVCSIFVLIVKGFYEFLLGPFPPHFLEQGPERFRPDPGVSKDRALSDAERSVHRTEKPVEKSENPLITKKAV